MQGQADGEGSAPSPEAVSLAFAPVEGLGPKFHAPATRSGMVIRSGLVTRLLASKQPVITVVAPPGYGKTTVLAQWAERLRSPVAWVSCEQADNDPVALWTAVTAALGVAVIGSSASHLLATSGGGVDAVAGLVAAFAAIEGPRVVVLDHVEAVTSRECRTAIAEFALRLPEGWRLALASRDQLPVAAARLRAEGRILEIGPNELAMVGGEAAGLFRGAGLELSDSLTYELVERTEGWPAGLYLAALAITAGSPAGGFTFTGDDRLIGEYLRSELLPRVSRSQARFLVLTSVLDRMCGPLCDAVVGRKGSARVLEELVTHNLLVVPLDRRLEWYRYHHLLRELLYAELRRSDQDLIPDLHSRAAAWYQANGMPEIAVEHAQAAGDTGRVAELVLDRMNPVWASGRVDTVRRWMEWLGERPPPHHFAAIAAHGALIFALLGRSGEADRWAAVAESLPEEGTLPDGSTIAGTMAYLRAFLCRDGPAGMRRDAREAWDGLSPTSPYRVAMLYTEGASYLLEGDFEHADAVLARAYDLASGFGIPPVAAMILSERFLVASEAGDWMRADSLAQRAVKVVEAGEFDAYWTSALVYSSAARAAAHRGDIPMSRDYIKRAARLRPLLTYALPVVSVQALLEMARTYVALVDPAGAGAVLDQAHAILQQRPDLGTLAGATDRLRSSLGKIAAAPGGASSLTAAELRLLPLLSTHLSLPAIGERLFLSRNTVKSQAISVYRKLGVSSRGEAVARMSELGLRLS